MPITSVDIPEEIMQYINSLLESGKATTFKALVNDLLSFHQRFSMGEWNDNIIYFYGLRHAFISKRSFWVIVKNMTEEEQYNIGAKMGKTLLDGFFARFGEPLTQEKWKEGLSLLENSGWGNFELSGKTILVRRPFLPPAMLHGYLEVGMKVKLKRLPTTEQIGVFEII